MAFRISQEVLRWVHSVYSFVDSRRNEDGEAMYESHLGSRQEDIFPSRSYSAFCKEDRAEYIVNYEEGRSIFVFHRRVIVWIRDDQTVRQKNEEETIIQDPRSNSAANSLLFEQKFVTSDLSQSNE